MKHKQTHFCFYKKVVSRNHFPLQNQIKRECFRLFTKWSPETTFFVFVFRFFLILFFFSFFCLNKHTQVVAKTNRGWQRRQNKISRETEGGKVGKQKHLTANSADP